MGKMTELIANGTLKAEDLLEARELIARAEFVEEAMEACKKNIVFSFAKDSVRCYDYMDNAGEYMSWGFCTKDGIFTCCCNWGGNHEIGSCDLKSFESVFMALDNEDFKADLKRFLVLQIDQAQKAQ